MQVQAMIDDLLSCKTKSDVVKYPRPFRVVAWHSKFRVGPNRVRRETPDNTVLENTIIVCNNYVCNILSYGQCSIYDVDATLPFPVKCVRCYQHVN